MKVLFMALLLSLSAVVYSQTVNAPEKISSPPASKVLVADETWVIASGKTSFRIITSNDTIAHRFMKNMEDCMNRVSYIQKTDRNGRYWERSFYFDNSYWNIVTLFINNKFR